MHVNVKSATVLEKNQVKNKQHHKKQSYNLITNKNNKSGVKNKLSTINEISLERKINL